MKHMLKPKVIIEVRGGIVQSVHSNLPLEYLVIDYDQDGNPEWEIGLPNTPDTVDENLCLSNLNYDNLSHATGYEEHP